MTIRCNRFGVWFGRFVEIFRNGSGWEVGIERACANRARVMRVSGRVCTCVRRAGAGVQVCVDQGENARVRARGRVYGGAREPAI